MKLKKGFTLIELLVVIAIIGLLSTLAVVALSSARLKARDAKRVSDTKQMQTALELYFSDKNEYPGATSDEIGVELFCLDNTNGWKTSVGCAAPLYMASAPKDPDNIAAGTPCKSNDTAGTHTQCNYAYIRLAGSSPQYNIHFNLEGKSGNLDKGPNCTTESGSNLTCIH